MSTVLDASIGTVPEVTYKTPLTVSRWYEYVDEDIDWNKNVKQGKGLRVGVRAPRSARRVVPTAEGKGSFTMEATSKGMGTLWQACLGTSTSTLVSGSTFQQVHTAITSSALMPSLTLQKTTPQVDGTLNAVTYTGVCVDSWEFNFPNADIATLKCNLDIADYSTATGYATPSYASSPNLYHFANGSIASGTLTAPTTTALAAGTTTIADVRGGSFTVNNNLGTGRQNVGGAGRKKQPYVGELDITGSLDIEYDNVTFRDAVLNETPMLLILTFTGGALSTGNETLQVVIPEIKFDGELPKTNGTDLIIQGMKFTGLDNLTAAQPIWVVTRTADAAL